ncbi:MAG: hypothetical protein QOF48_1830, partial [Verrucomicrobiota bacterium]
GEEAFLFGGYWAGRGEEGSPVPVTEPLLVNFNP